MSEIKDPQFYIDNPEFLLEDNFAYHKLKYSEICTMCANKAIAYIADDGTPIMEIFDEKGEVSSRVALIKSEWTVNTPEYLEFGGEIYCTDVKTFLEKVAAIQKPAH